MIRNNGPIKKDENSHTFGHSSYLGLNRDNPTPDETEMQRNILEGRLGDLDPEDARISEEIEDARISEEIQYEEYMRFHRANDLLRSSEYADTPIKKANWLEKLGYYGINVRGIPKPVSFEDALKAGRYKNNIHMMFINEKKNLMKIRKETRKYLEDSGFFKSPN